MAPHPSPRIIPALAGNTRSRPGRAGEAGDHPRSRGEYGTGAQAADLARGSSPLSRGIPRWAASSAAVVGIIPALAGNTHQVQHRRSETDGSSPLSRGIPDPAAMVTDRTWIIPALAGNTSGHMILTRLTTDHPRSRGEYRSHVAPSIGHNGSSPLSRGIHYR